MNMGNFSPNMLAATKSVKPFLLCFSPLQRSHLRCNDFFCNVWWNFLNLSAALKMLQLSKFGQIVGKVGSFQGAVISSITYFPSPTDRNKSLVIPLHVGFYKISVRNYFTIDKKFTISKNAYHTYFLYRL